MNLYELACQQLWAMREGELRGMLSLLARESLDPDLARQIRDDRASRTSALAAQSGAKLDNTRAVAMRGSTAIMEVIGPIVRRADMFSEISGATDVGTLSRDFATAMAAPNVEAVLFVLDSPGGEVTGIHEFAQMIMDARNKKPIWAYIEGNGASAAYWIASAAGRIIAAATADVGWIGVVMAMRDPTKTKSDTIEFVSSNAPKKRPDVMTEAGRAQLQAMVDATAEVFDASVAAGRNVSVETVNADFGQGGGLIGKAALAAHLVDGLGSFESTLADLQAYVSEQRQQSQSVMLGAMEEPMDWKAFWQPLLGENAAVEGAPLAALIDGQGNRARLESADAESAELIAMRAQIATMQAEAIARDAQAFAVASITAGHAYPAEQAALVQLYTVLAMDDAAHPVASGPTRIAHVSAAIEARPANRLAGTLLPSALPNGAAVLSNAGGENTLLDDAEASARAYAQKANGRAK